MEIVYALDKTINQTEKEQLIDTIIVKTQGFINGNIKEGDKYPVAIFKNRYRFNFNQSRPRHLVVYFSITIGEA